MQANVSAHIQQLFSSHVILLHEVVKWERIRPQGKIIHFFQHQREEATSTLIHKSGEVNWQFSGLIPLNT